MATFILGKDAKIYQGTAGGALGTLTEMSNVKDVTLSLESGEADVTTRANQGWRAKAATLKEGSVEFEMQWDTADAGFTAIRTAYFNNTAIGLRILDGEDGEGLEADFSITQFSRKEPLEEAISVSVTAKVTYSTTPPTWKTANT